MIPHAVVFHWTKTLPLKNTNAVKPGARDRPGPKWNQYGIALHTFKIALTVYFCTKLFWNCKGQNQSKCRYTCLGISSRTLSNFTCSKYIYRSKWVGHFWLVKALSCIVEGGQNDKSKWQVKNAPVCTFGSTVKTVSSLVFGMHPHVTRIKRVFLKYDILTLPVYKQKYQNYNCPSGPH